MINNDLHTAHSTSYLNHPASERIRNGVLAAFKIDEAVPAHHPGDLHVKRDGQRFRQCLQYFPLGQPRVMNSVASDGIDQLLRSGVNPLQRRTVQISKADEPLALPDDPANHVLNAPLDLSLISGDRKSTRLNSSHVAISYAVFCLKKTRRCAVST